MTEIEVLAALAGGLLLLWWWPPPTAPVPAAPRSGESPDLVLLTQLLAGLATAGDFAGALDSLPADLRARASPSTAGRLQEIQELTGQAGLPGTLLVRQLQREAQTAVALRERWREKAAGSIATASLLAGLPLPILLAAQGSGINVASWLFGTPYGVADLAAATLLTAASIARIRGAARSRPRVREGGRTIPASTAAMVAAVAVFLVRSDLFGLLAAGFAAAAVGQLWPRLQPAKNQHRLVETSRSRPWVATVLGAALVAGLDWRSAAALAGRTLSPLLRPDWLDIGRRLAWGVVPEQAFALGPAAWHQIGNVVDQCQRTGAPVAQALLTLAGSWQTELQSAELVRIEKRAANLVVTVTMLQLPAFILVGLVPLVAATLLPLLQTYTSTGAL